MSQVLSPASGRCADFAALCWICFCLCWVVRGRNPQIPTYRRGTSASDAQLDSTRRRWAAYLRGGRGRGAPPESFNGLRNQCSPPLHQPSQVSNGLFPLTLINTGTEPWAHACLAKRGHQVGPQLQISCHGSTHSSNHGPPTPVQAHPTEHAAVWTFVSDGYFHLCAVERRGCDSQQRTQLLCSHVLRASALAAKVVRDHPLDSSAAMPAVGVPAHATADVVQATSPAVELPADRALHLTLPQALRHIPAACRRQSAAAVLPVCLELGEQVPRLSKGLGAMPKTCIPPEGKPRIEYPPSICEAPFLPPSLLPPPPAALQKHCKR